MEEAMESFIRHRFPDIRLECNDKSLIGYELDFYMPDIRLAIEVNGIFHYEPIYGQGKLDKIVENDRTKMHLCREAGVELVVVPTHDGERWSKKRTKKYLAALEDIISCAAKRL